MLFWIIATALVMITMLAVALPVMRGGRADATDAAVAQALAAELRDIEADDGARFASPAEAQSARAEVGRRLLALQRSQAQGNDGKSPQGRFAFVLMLVPILAVPIYMVLGQPEYPDQRFATRADRSGIESQREVEQLVARVEQRLRQVPDDGRGWALIAPIYARMGRLDDALAAYNNAVTHFDGPPQQRAELLAGRAELLVAKGNGAVSPEAAQGFEAALAADPDNQKALFFRAIGLEQAGGDTAAARANWQGLIERFAVANPPWLAVARERLAAMDALAANPLPAAPGPTPEQVDAAAALSNAEQKVMIEGMVNQLAEKLAADPSDAEGWSRLIRSRMVLGDRAQAGKDLETARSHFATGTEERVKLDSFAASLGLTQ